MKLRVHRPAAAAALGVLSVGAFAPVELPWLAPATLGLLFFLWLEVPSPRAAAWLGFLFGLGFFGTGVSWVYVSLHEFGRMPAPLAALATVVFCAYLALFPALVGSLQARLEVPHAVRALLAAPALWVLAEWLRGWLLTGFPWLAIGYSQADTPLAGYAPLAGVHGVSLALAIAAGALASALAYRGPLRRAAALALAIALYAGGAVLARVEWTRPGGEPVTVAMLQGNVAQSLKFEPSRYATTLESYRRLVESAHARLVVLPETAIPRFLDLVDPAYLDGLAGHARERGADILLGVPFRDGRGRYYNGVVTLGASPMQFFAKRHLVPLGEFVPPELAWIVAALRIPLSDFSRGEAPRPLEAAGQKLAVTVCYEDAFGEELIEQLPQAGLLVNVSNVAWFGDSLAPAQHLEISRMRSLESGRYMLRATNTGITAIVDERGRVTARLPQFVEGALHGSVRAFAGETPFVSSGNLPVLSSCALALALCAALALAPRRPSGR